MILETKDLTKIYQGAEDVIALDHVNFTMEKGDLTAIIGASGSGKYTLLHLLAGVDKKTSGDVFIDGVNITSLKDEEMTIFRRRNIGVVYQFFNLIQTINVRKNILLPLLLDHQRDDIDYFNKIIKILQIDDKLDRFPSELSGGEQQRVSIARALITKPFIILCDEPTGNLDRLNSKEIVGLLRLVNKKFETTILIITHDEKVSLSCHKIYRMVDGKISLVGDDFYENC